MTNKIWEKNITELSKYHEDLQYLIDGNIKNNENDIIQIETEKAYTDETISVVITDNGRYYLSGKYSPEGMAKRIADKYKDTHYGAVIVIIGLSDGRMINQLVELVKKEVTIVIYEPSERIFLHTMQNYDCSKLFQRKAVNWIVGENKEEILEGALSLLLTIDNLVNVKVIVQGNYDKIFGKEVRKAISILNNCVSKIRIRWNTNMVFSDKLVVNTVRNAKYLYQHYSINAMFDTLPADIPVIVVAAGPSLDKNIDQLKAAKGKACIFACDTALKPLLKHGVVPDFFFVVDPSKPMELFADERVWTIPLVTGINIPAEIMEKHKGAKIICLDNYLIVDMLKSLFGQAVNEPRHIMSDLPTGGSVATTAFSAARLMGAKTIILVGQDLAFSGGKEHAEGTFQNDRKVEDVKKGTYVEDINGELVKTTGDFKLYLDWYEEELSKYPSLNVIDATEGGARIKGTKICTLREAIDQYCKATFDSEDYLQKLPLHFNEKEQQDALEYIHNVPRRFKKIEKKIKDGEKWYRKLEQIAKNPSYDSKELNKILKKIKNINLFIENDYLTDMIMDGVKQEEYLIRTNIYRFGDDEQKNLLESAQMGLRLMEKMKKTLNKMWPDIEELGKFNGVYEK